MAQRDRSKSNPTPRELATLDGIVQTAKHNDSWPANTVPGPKTDAGAETMRPSRLTQLSTTCLVLLTLATSPATSQARKSTAEPKALHLGGSVVDSDGNALSGVEVELFSPVSYWEGAKASWTSQRVEPDQSTRTNAAGEFAVKLPRAGFYSLEFHAKGFASARWTTTAPLLEDLDLLPVELGATRKLSLKVVDQEGQPITSARIVAYTHGARPSFEERLTRQRSMSYLFQREAVDENAERTFTISTLAGGVRISAPGFVPQAPTFDPDNGNLERTIELVPAEAATVRIKNSDGTPASGAVIVRGRTTVAVTNDEGTAQVPLGSKEDPAPAARYTAFGQQNLTGVNFRASDTSTTKTQTFTLVDPATFPGRVFDKETSKPIANVWVWSASNAVAQSKPDGSYQLTGPAFDPGGGPVRIRTRAVGFFDSSQPLTPDLVQSKTAPAFALEPAASIIGVVVDTTGQPIEGAKLTTRLKDITALATSGDRGSQSLNAISDASGSFSLGPLMSATPFTVVAKHKDFANSEVSLSALRTGQPKRITIQMTSGARAFGQVVDEAGLPVLGATVELNVAIKTQDITAMISQRFSGASDSRSATTDGNGDFRFDALGAGDYDVAITAPGFAPAKIQAVAVPSAEELLANAPPNDDIEGQPLAPPFELGTITLSPGAVIEGVVRSASGRSLKGAGITISETGGTMVMVASMMDSGAEPDAISDADGRFVFDSLAPNTPYKIDVELDGFAGKTLSSVKAPSNEPVEIKLDPASTLSGIVVNQLSEPLPNARVSINQQMGSGSGGMMNFNPSRMMKNVQTDEDGRFEMESLGSGKWNLVAASKGYIDHERKGIELEPGVDPPEQRIVMQKGATLSGTVLGADGSPLAGVNIERVIAQRNMFDVSRANRRVARTDGDGSYTLEGLPLGKASFSAKHSSHQDSVRDANIQEGDNRLDFSLDRGLTISGSVVDPTGLPVEGARVKAGQAGAGFAIMMASGGGGGPRPALTDTDGNFTLDGLKNGSYTVSASKDGFAEGEAEIPVRLDGNDESGVLIRLTTGAAITGVISGLEFDELSQVQIMVMQPGAGTSPLMAQVNYEGEYRLDNVGAGDWMVMATVGQGRNARETVTIEPGQREIVVDFEFGGGLTLSGRVMRNGQPESGTMVVAAGTSSSGNGQTTTNPDGEFVIEGLEPGGYRVIVTNMGSSPHQETVELVADYNLEIDIQDASITGRIIDQESGAALEGVELTLTRTDDTDGSLGAFSIFGLGGAPRSDAAGNFRLEGVVAGGYRISATKEGYGAGTVDITVDGGDVSGIEIALEGAVALTVYVFSASGNPARQVGFTVLDSNEQPVLSQTRSLAEGGRLDIKDLPDGNWQLLVAENRGGATARNAIKVPGDPVQVRIPPSGGLRLTVPALATDQLSARVTLFDQQGRQYRAAGLQGMLASVNGMVIDGRAMLNAIPVGVWRVVVESTDGEQKWESTARVIEGTTVDYLVE